MQTGFAGLHLFAGKLSLFALHFVGAEQSPAPTERIPKAPLAGELSAKQTERLSQIRLNLSVSAPPSHLPWKGRLWDCALQGFPYEGKAEGSGELTGRAAAW